MSWLDDFERWAREDFDAPLIIYVCWLCSMVVMALVVAAYFTHCHASAQ